MNTKKLFSYETFVHAISGAAGGVTAMTVFFPLDTIRSRLQVEDSREAKTTILAIKELIDQEGISSLYRGLEPVLTSLCCSNFVYFYTFHGLRSLVETNNTGKNALRDLTVAAIAGALNVVTTTPLWVANSRLKMQGAKLSSEDKKKLGDRPMYLGTIDAITKIADKEGWQSLWSGMVPSLMLVINPAIQFTVYEALKAEYCKVFGSKNVGGLSVFIIGALSKCISTVLTYPLQIVQSKLRYGTEKLKKMTIIQIFAYILRTSGAKGLYKGLESKLLQTTLTSAFMFVCYEKIVAYVFYLMGVHRPLSKAA
ncbi:peroxisomal membrane protein PMP34 [Nephila pilipes]|uniref:Peroxisomal membrane protein PMP34 n=1 Tax=Nephila pilipes TaxID=299642 RepID=A0A8X6UCE6_NEPPI|nr:peroxisomal membrane protein PMP34 [Nephila pilipes]GFU00360.1 peroxisomal membrane protein PMP34 [Nephila pilipes]